MDYINKLTGGDKKPQGDAPTQQQQQQTQQSGSSSSFMDKLHGMAGGGPESEKKEDSLGKGMPTYTTSRPLTSTPLGRKYSFGYLCDYVIMVESDETEN
jgi:hypothetical protein